MTKQFLPPLKEITDPNNPPEGVKHLITIADSLNYPNDFESFLPKGTNSLSSLIEISKEKTNLTLNQLGNLMHCCQFYLGSLINLSFSQKCLTKVDYPMEK